MAKGFAAGIWQLGDHTKNPSWTVWFKWANVALAVMDLNVDDGLNDTDDDVLKRIFG